MDIQELKKQAEDIRSQNPTTKSIFWPKGFRQQAVDLMNEGHSAHSLSRLTDISVSTIYSWKASKSLKKKKQFKQMKIIDKETKGLSLFWESGLSIKGLSFPQLKELLKEGLL